MGKKTDLTPSFSQSEIVSLQKMPTGGGSDLTLKMNVTDMQPALSKILALRPVTWDWKDRPVSIERNYGFIAQEVEKIMPDLVYVDTWTDGTERKFIKTKELLPYLVTAIKEQQAQINELRTYIQSQLRQGDKTS